MRNYKQTMDFEVNFSNVSLITTGTAIVKTRISHVSIARRDSSCRTQMDLLKPLGRADRAIDTLGHYQKRTKRPGRPAATLRNFKPWDLPWDYIF